jgi:hypothetical protein
MAPFVLGRTKAKPRRSGSPEAGTALWLLGHPSAQCVSQRLLPEWQSIQCRGDARKPEQWMLVLQTRSDDQPKILRVFRITMKNGQTKGGSLDSKPYIAAMLFTLKFG